MALSIKDDYADSLAREVAALTGGSLTHAVTVALEEKLAREKKRKERDIQRRRAHLEKIAAKVKKAYRGQKIPSSKELMDTLYDEHGLPI